MIAHADMDAFFAAVEILDNPALRGLPVIVGGRSARGVVTSASYEARKFGVRSAMPTAQAQKLCPDGVFVPGRMNRYVEISRVVQRVFESFSPVVEPLSLDEAFIDLTGTERLLGPALGAARDLKRRVLEETGLVVSVGVAPTKMAAKILSDMSKPDGLLAIGPEYLTEFLRPLPVERLWGVGRVTLARLNEHGIRTVGDLASRDAAELKSLFSSMGLHLHELASGHDARHVIADWQRKSYGEENTFAHDLAQDSDELHRALIAHGDTIARRLRADKVRARTITLKLKLARPLGGGRYPLVTRSFSLEHSTNDGPEITRLAIHLLSRVRDRDKIRLAGVQVHHLERADDSQLGLFDSAPTVNDDRKRDRLNRALDVVNKKFGEEAVTRGLARAERAAPSRRIK
ncbi:MAG: DNA polymerase IV [Candidatus Binatus sp.]|uniref:DNA polymerase IV n=1 Tax=Candidatus Binatus sp. TaxID=2811406 RepID=UPI0027288605|nr:DNA polymerase IV [Candidatus Binatus sp.]MDO8433680.1 DNA polymerase IV [Candidatus Binatus sp.]